jgi:hypothetical protein
VLFSKILCKFCEKIKLKNYQLVIQTIARVNALLENFNLQNAKKGEKHLVKNIVNFTNGKTDQVSNLALPIP